MVGIFIGFEQNLVFDLFFFATTSIEPPGISAWTDRHDRWQLLIWQVDKDDSHLEEGQSSVIICSVHTEDKSG